MPAGKLRHRVTVLRPPPAHGSRGELQGQPQVVLEKWPCSITPLGGTESDEAGGTLAQNTYSVEGYASRKNPIMPKDYLLLDGRVLHIATVEDLEMNGMRLRLTCGEEIQRG